MKFNQAIDLTRPVFDPLTDVVIYRHSRSDGRNEKRLWNALAMEHTTFRKRGPGYKPDVVDELDG